MNPEESSAQSRHDPQLQPTRAPALQGILDAPGGTLRQQRDARSHAEITLGGRRAFATGTETHGLRNVWLHAQPAVCNFTTVDFSVASIIISPGFVQRSTASLQERVCLPRDLSALVWQWTARTATPLQLVWTVPLKPDPETHPAGWNSADQWLLARLGGKRSQSVLYCFNRAITWELHEQSASLRVRATAALQPGESITLVVAAGYTEGALEEVARALDQLSTLAPARASVTNRIERERVSLRSPWGWLNDDWTWALQQLDSLMVEAPAGLHTPLTGWAADPDIAPRFKTGEAVVAGLAALSAGDHDTAHQLIEFLATTQNSSGEIAAGGKLTGTLEFTDHNAARQFLLLVAQYFAWTGEIGCVRRVWVHVRRAVASGQFNQVDAEGAAAVLRQLSQTAEAIGEREDGVAFKAHADQRVPGVSAQSQTPWQSLWSIVEHDDEFTAGPGFAIAPVIYGFCGAVPDAARNRIELKTEIPLGWEFLELNNLRVGDNRFSFEYRRQGLSHSFRLRPLAGAVPLRVILEPALFATGIRQVSVDGQDAQLDIRRVGNRWICPLQIVVDHDREIVIEASDSEDA